MEAVARRLRRGTWFFGGDSGPDRARSPSEKAAYRLAKLLNRVKEVLDMYPRIGALTIKIFRDRDGVNEAYFHFFGRRPGYKSFYFHQTETIYTSEDDISASVMAHEMGHAVIDSYFSVVPPPKIAEMLATYVDAHLED